MWKVGLQKFRPKKKKNKATKNCGLDLDSVPPEKMSKETAINCWNQGVKQNK